MTKNKLYIFSGLPATGKSTLAQLLARKLGATYVRADTIEQALRDLCQFDVVDQGYELAYRLIAENLALGNSVIADSVNPYLITRQAYQNLAIHAGCDFINIEVACSDKLLHQKRAENRTVAVKNLKLPTWSEIVKRDYQPWPESDEKALIKLDTAGKSIEQSFSELAKDLEL